ncbi:unnamed protein product [Tuber aestivum]|uniref:Uncharacterized protein n=1 Tax=Tuber aestivum TaxID=59557 RepID=A0A292PWN0_9PEZI|nr:unnamed protein product [Tuber aestivum]
MAKRNLSQPKSPFYILFRAFQFTLTLSLLSATVYLRWGYKIKGHFSGKQDASSSQEKSVITVSSFHQDQRGNTDEHDNPDNYAITNANILSPFIGLSILIGAIAGFSLIGKFLSDIDAWGTEAPIIYFYKAAFGAAIVAM